jgi:hypothetical protein
MPTELAARLVVAIDDAAILKVINSETDADVVCAAEHDLISRSPA